MMVGERRSPQGIGGTLRRRSAWEERPSCSLRRGSTAPRWTLRTR